MENSSLKEHLRLLEERLLEPEVRKSVKEIEILLADDFIEFGTSGHTYNKQQCICGLSIVQMTLMDFDVKLLAPDVMLATYRTINHQNMQYSLRSSIWKFKNDKWQMVFHQGLLLSLLDSAIVCYMQRRIIVQYDKSSDTWGDSR